MMNTPEILRFALMGTAVCAFNAPLAASEGAIDSAANWRQHCQRCHGADGSGKTRIGARLKLQDYTDAAVNASISDNEIIDILKNGVTDERGREVKPNYTDVMSEAEIAAMVAYIRGMAKAG